jgi:hypothetical protein
LELELELELELLELDLDTARLFSLLATLLREAASSADASKDGLSA